MVDSLTLTLNRVVFSREIQHQRLLNVLLTHDGSTTRLCTAANNETVQIIVHEQIIINNDNNAITLPYLNEVKAILGGTAWLQRITSLYNQDGDVLMDNLSFTRIDKDSTPEWFIEALNQGQTPIGRLLDQLFVKRTPINTSVQLQSILWSCVGLYDINAARSYCVATPQGSFMLIFEVFRDSLRTVLNTEKNR